MKKYFATVGVYVRTYAKFEVEAENDQAAIAATIAKFKADDGDIAFEDTDWQNMAQPSIASLYNDDTGEDIDAACGHDFALQPQDAQELAAPDMLHVLKQIHAAKKERETAVVLSDVGEITRLNALLTHLIDVDALAAITAAERAL